MILPTLKKYKDQRNNRGIVTSLHIGHYFIFLVQDSLVGNLQEIDS